MARQRVGRAQPSLRPRPWRGRRGFAGRWLRALLLTLGLLGLVPLAEAVDLLVVGAHAAELTAVACDEDCDDACEDADCHGDLHHCGCCAPMPRIAPSAAWSLPGPRATTDGPRSVAQLRPPERAPPPPWQPPRA